MLPPRFYFLFFSLSFSLFLSFCCCVVDGRSFEILEYSVFQRFLCALLFSLIARKDMKLRSVDANGPRVHTFTDSPVTINLWYLTE